MSVAQSLKVIVPIKRVVDPNIKVLIKDDGQSLDIEHVKMSINPFDEIALEEAIRLKEQGLTRELIAVSIGGEKNTDILRNALAMGADRAIHILTEQQTEPLLIAKILKKIVEEEQADLILMGKQAIDDDANQTGQMLAALLDIAQACQASDIKIDGSQVNVKMEVDNGQQEIAINLPCVITVDLRLNQPRFISLMQIMKAKKQPITTINLDDMQIKHTPNYHIIAVNAPPKRGAATMVNDIDELLDFIKQRDITLGI
ncbi:electron transfer flavoprotein subunit beta/FixA family protein [Bartonella sp. DGB1]|uniref:electron transfer flavoprotein subunit beta/FixA family protein n=1 Tax=Bartonella sp. DGB1 TaxID=3239807 RepID=UPI0035255F6A